MRGDELIRDRFPGSPVQDPETVSLEQFSYETRLQARKMTPAYQLLFCFENAVRELVEARLKEAFGLDDWWKTGVSDQIRKAAEKRHREEKRLRWHGSRGDSLLNYIDFPQLAEIILEKWDVFEDLLGSQDFIRNRFDELNLSRRVLAHTGVLSPQDVNRMKLHLQDWIAQVG